MHNILIIGYGKTGSHLYYALKSSRLKLKLSIIKNSRQKINSEAVKDAGVIFICTQDDKIPAAVNSLLKTGVSMKGKITAHTSGVHNSDELAKLNAQTASFHPVQTFESRAKRNSGRFKKIHIAIEGTSSAEKILANIAVKIGSIPFIIEKRFKTLHHICCVIASNFTVTNLSFIPEIYRRKNGFKKLNFFNIYMPLILQTLSNISHKGIGKSLTGPVARGDIKTVEKHIKELRKIKSKELTEYYKFISNITLDIAGNISKKHFRNLLK